MRKIRGDMSIRRARGARCWWCRGVYHDEKGLGLCHGDEVLHGFYHGGEGLDYMVVGWVYCGDKG